MLNEVKEHINHDSIKGQYKGVTEFVRSAIRDKLDRERFIQKSGFGFNEPFGLLPHTREARDSLVLTLLFSALEEDLKSNPKKLRKLLKEAEAEKKKK